jgi:predicted secreted protein
MVGERAREVDHNASDAATDMRNRGRSYSSGSNGIQERCEKVVAIAKARNSSSTAIIDFSMHARWDVAGSICGWSAKCSMVVVKDG